MPLFPIPGGTAGYEAVGTGGGQSFVRPAVIDLSRPPYNATLDDADITTALLTAVDDLDTASSGGVILLPRGRGRVTQTIALPAGVAVSGGFGAGYSSGGVKSRPTTLTWHGPADDPFIEAIDLGAPNNTAWLPFSNLSLQNGSTRFGHGLVFLGRCDSMTTVDRFQVAGGNGNGIRFEQGGLNIYLRAFRFDGLTDYGIYWKLSGSDSLTLDDFTTDSYRSTTAYGTFRMDGGSAVANTFLHFAARSAKLETNQTMVTGGSHFRFEVNPALAQRAQFQASFEDVWEARASGVSGHYSIAVSPASDSNMFVFQNCSGLTVDGVPSFANSIIGVNARTPFSVIAPNSVSHGGPASEKTASEFVGDVNIMGHAYVYGKLGTLIGQYTTSDLSGVTLLSGQWLIDPATVASGHRVIREVSVSGTLGTLAGVTGSGASGQQILTVNTTTGLRVGQRITVGSDTKNITNINRTTKAVTLSSNLGSTYTDQAVSYAAPTFREGQLIPLTGSKTYDPASVAAGGSTTTTVTVTGAALGDFVVPSFSLDLQGLVLSAYVSASNTVTCVLSNPTAGAVDLGSGTLKVKVSSR